MLCNPDPIWTGPKWDEAAQPRPAMLETVRYHMTPAEDADVTKGTAWTQGPKTHFIKHVWFSAAQIGRAELWLVRF